MASTKAKPRIYNKIRIFLISFTAIFFIAESSYAQIPEEFIGTWYLEYFSTSQGETYVNTLDVSQGPSFTVTESLQITGNSFCNDFSGEYIYVDPGPLAVDPLFQPINIIRGTIDCGSNEVYETQFYVPFVNEQVADIVVLQEDFLVLQYYNPTLYQVYRDEPVLSLEENELSEIQVYPNPVKNELFISNKNSLKINSWMILGVVGKVIREIDFSGESIDVSTLPSGIYFLRIEAQQGILTKKIVKL